MNDKIVSSKQNKVTVSKDGIFLDNKTLNKFQFRPFEICSIEFGSVVYPLNLYQNSN